MIVFVRVGISFFLSLAGFAIPSNSSSFSGAREEAEPVQPVVPSNRDVTSFWEDITSILPFDAMPLKSATSCPEGSCDESILTERYVNAT